jgi:hypothetical protein
MNRRDFLRYGAIGLVAATAPRARARAADIVRCVIHPAIGIARVGNSPNEFFVGPEAPGVHPAPDGGFKDAAGRLKRQAARFRIFGLDADGNVVKELTTADAEITWTVHLANAKAAWYEFTMPFDIPEAMGRPPAEGASAAAPLVSPRRNSRVRGIERARLVIDPGPRSISGANLNSAGGDSRYAFDTGRFLDRTVSLGDLRTDEAGHLLVLGGFGASAPAGGPGTAIFAGEDGWQDDVADGPVEATVRIGNRVIEAAGAWVVVAPPNYAPGIPSIVTMYDLIFEVATRLEPERAPPRPSFTRQIYPLFERHVRNQWVNAGFARDFGWGAADDFLAPALLSRLADPSPAHADLRRALFARFRDPAYPHMQPNALPPYYGDNTQLVAETPRQWMAVLPIQYGWLRQWAEGDFDADWPADGLRFPGRLEELPAAEQPAALDRAALDECLGGPFHPGCEMTWPMRIASLYAAPFRLRRRTNAEPDWGDAMTSAIALAPDGPLSASGPGSLTRWMAVPWQVDTASCLSAYQPGDEYLPAFWPARVPNDVISAAAYETVLDAAVDPQRRRQAFRERRKWLRPLPLDQVSGEARVNAFLRGWSRFGVVTRRRGPPDDPAFPPDLWVESDRDRSLG